MAASSGSWSFAIFSKADIKPLGCLVSATEDESAKNSRLLETASWISWEIIGESIAKIIPRRRKIAEA